MALIPRFALHKPVSFLPQSIYVQIGRRPEDDEINSHYSSVQYPLWERLIDARLRIEEAKTKFANMNLIDIQERWRHWDEQTIDSYRLQFRAIDINEDGLIDFKELCDALDEIGDKSTTEQRRKYFKEVDTDQSEGVDFEEFLELIDRVHHSSAMDGSGEGFGKMEFAISAGVKNVQRIGELSLDKQIQHGLF